MKDNHDLFLSLFHLLDLFDCADLRHGDEHENTEGDDDRNYEQDPDPLPGLFMHFPRSFEDIVAPPAIQVND